MASSSEPQGQADAMVLAPAVGVGVPSLPPDTRHTLLKTATMPKKGAGKQLEQRSWNDSGKGRS